ncbi:penicillin-binding protein [Cryobacterium breve]|uniref:Penicillin-binding protein n=2 Tax=Cryobacterium TaxID=69578 RepID=A0ABY7NBY5_9MICO|nr:MULTISPECIES: transglycosylase domain-containing protein [Cryobacterium]MEA9999765.1 transglycosylase domain-containing protein [Cryobacterium sp. RTS3]MEB0267871.1 transglycosylase domain-containing protein [Cryobacterium sp. 10I5]WBM80029.1 penicillin-binding protein [Cryobacterium breve]
MRTTEFQERRTPGGVMGGLVGLVAMSAVAGLLVAASVTPVVALSGLAVTDTINTFESLPEYLSIDRLSQKSNIYAMQGDGSPRLLASFYDQNRIEVGSDAISPFVTDAAISSEDPRFYAHGGIDLQGTIRAGLSVSLGGATQGGSSITQQYVKNVLVQKCEVLPDPAGRDSCYAAATRTSAERKVKEMRLAIGVEKKYSKKDILRQYLNITGFGGTVYGIEAAAEYYFNTTAAAVSLPQAASLVAIINNPVKFQLDDPNSATNGAANGYAANRERRDYILGTMLKYGTIGPADYAAAVAAPVEPSIQEPSTGCQTAGGSAYFCDYVTHVLRNDPAFGADADTRLLNFRRGGYNVYTTIDLDLQIAAETTMKQNVPMTFPGWDVGAVISSVQVGTGRVLAMVQNKDYSQDPVVEATGANYTSINFNTDYADGGSSGFQPGSGYKVFTLAEWLKEGHALYERVDSRRKANWGTFQDSCLGPQNYDKEKWNPKNDANESGAHYSALEATVGSINTGYIGMAKKLDLCGIRKTAEAFRMHRADETPLLESASSVIGTNEIAPLSMAVAFAGIANKGVTCSPIVIDRIVGPTGQDVPVPSSECAASVDPTVAAGMAYAMRKVMTNGTGQQSNRGMVPQVPVIGKTGTTDGNKDTWMTGASTKVATVVAVVSLTGDANQRTTYFDSGQAATARHRMWPAVMSVANAKYGGDAFIEANPSPTPTPKPAAPRTAPTPTPSSTPR